MKLKKQLLLQVIEVIYAHMGLCYWSGLQNTIKASPQAFLQMNFANVGSRFANLGLRFANLGLRSQTRVCGRKPMLT